MTRKRWTIVKNKWHSLKQENWDEKWDSEMLMNNVLRDFKTHCRQAGIKTNDKLTIHCLRKSYACNLANSNTPVQTLMKLMGHGSIQTTMEYYLQSSDANEKAAVEKLDRMMVGEGGRGRRLYSGFPI